MVDDALRVSITDDDIAAAKTACHRALDGDESQERVDLLYDDLERLIRLQAHKIAQDLRGAAGVPPPRWPER